MNKIKLALVAVMSVVSMVALTAAPAGANSGGGIYYQSAAGTVGNQCAWWQASADWDSVNKEIDVTSRTSVGNTGSCLGYQALPDGWIVASVELQKWSSSAGAFVKDTAHYAPFQSWTTVPTGAHDRVYGSVSFNCLRPNYYRIVTGHTVLLAGAARTAIWASDTIQVTSTSCGFYYN